MKTSDKEKIFKKIQPSLKMSAFYNWGTQYYLSGRFAFLNKHHPVAEILFHHSIEMFLKGALLYKGISEEKLKKDFGHKLKKLWETFKKFLQDPDLDNYDDLILELDKWDDIRYPRAGNIAMVFDTHHNPKPTKITFSKGNEPEIYTVTLENLDKLVKIIFNVTSVDPQFFQSLINSESGVQNYLEANKFPIIKKVHEGPETVKFFKE